MVVKAIESNILHMPYHLMRFQDFMYEQKTAYDAGDGSALRSVGNSGMRITCGVKTEKISVLCENHSLFAIGTGEMLSVGSP